MRPTATRQADPGQLDAATLVTDELMRLTSPRIEAALLFGSMARGDPGPGSDVDLLVVTDEEIRSSEVSVYTPRLAQPAAIQAHTRTSLCRMLCSQRLFVRHITDEGRVLIDRHGWLAAELRAAAIRPLRLAEELADESAALAPYRRITYRSAADPVVALADIYRSAKAVAMVGVALGGTFEFGRRRAFTALASRRGDLAEDAVFLNRLEPFYATITGRPCELPSIEPTVLLVERALLVFDQVTGRLLEEAYGSCAA